LLDGERNGSVWLACLVEGEVIFFGGPRHILLDHYFCGMLRVWIGCCHSRPPVVVADSTGSSALDHTQPPGTAITMAAYKSWWLAFPVKAHPRTLLWCFPYAGGRLSLHCRVSQVCCVSVCPPNRPVCRSCACVPPRSVSLPLTLDSPSWLACRQQHGHLPAMASETGRECGGGWAATAW
jgi:hypothetical protein